MATIVRRLHLGLEDQHEQRYQEVAFEVAGERSVEVSLAYDRTQAVIDLGCEDPQRWRGWSGGARSRFVITADAATPGYEPGELPDGRWAVVLGLHAVPAAGVDVEVTITVPAEGPVEADPEPPPPPDGPRGHHRDLPAEPGLTWYAGDFHAHSLHSDGDRSLAQLAARAADHGLDFLAVTEHNTVSHHPHLPAVGAAYDLTLVAGQEITTARGHANAFGDIGWIDFRTPAATWEPEVEARGGLLSINHPLETDVAWQHALPSLPPVLEFWHIGWFRDLTASAMWALWSTWRQDASLVGGSDFHHADGGWPPGTPTTWVAAEDRSQAAILEAVRAGRTALTLGPGAEHPLLLRQGDELLALGADGTVLVDVEGRRRHVVGDRRTFPAGPASTAGGGGPAPHRLESASGDLLAVSP